MLKDATAEATPLHTGVRDETSVSTALTSVLRDTYRLMLKTQIYHWNVTGREFRSIHLMTEEQYEAIFKAGDELAERVRALGHKAPTTIANLLEGAVIDEAIANADATEMLEDLAADNERMAHRLRALSEISERQRDPVTADMASERAEEHEKFAWMLRSSI